MKLISIGGYLTILKYVLGSLLIYILSIFKIPNTVYHMLEVIGSHFLGVELHEGKILLSKMGVSLTFEDKGGFGVGGVYACN